MLLLRNYFWPQPQLLSFRYCFCRFLDARALDGSLIYLLSLAELITFSKPLSPCAIVITSPATNTPWPPPATAVRRCRNAAYASGFSRFGDIWHAKYCGQAPWWRVVKMMMLILAGNRPADGHGEAVRWFDDALLPLFFDMPRFWLASIFDKFSPIFRRSAI